MKKLLTLLALFVTLTALGQTAEEHYKAGNEKANAQDFAGSIKDFDKAIKLDPKHTDAFYNRATSKIYLKDYKGAIADYDKAIELKPDFLSAYTNRAVAKLKSDDTKGAIKDFDSVLKLDSKNAAAYFMRGQVKLQAGDADSGCEDLAKAKQLGDNRADKFIEKYCGGKSGTVATPASNESLMLDWPDAEGWKVAGEQENEEQKMIELLRNNETFDNWTEIGTMFVYKNVSAAKKLPITKTMDIIYEGSKKNCPTSKVTLIEKDENAKYPWIIFKVECSGSSSESQVWYAIQGTNELFLNFRAVKQKTIPADLQNKWVIFFKTAKIVTP